MTESNKSAEPQSRRDYVKTIGALAVGLGVGAAAGWLGKPPEVAPGAATTTATVTETLTTLSKAINPITEAGLGGEGQKYYMIVPGTTPMFYKPIINAVELAGKLIGAKAVFTGPPQYDIAAQVNALENALVAKPDGIAYEADDPGLEDIAGRILDSGIPTCIFNGNIFRDPMVPKYKGTRFEQLGYIGQNFYPAGVRLGRAAGALAAEKYGKGCHFLFTTINPGESGLEIRMSGQAEGLKEYGHTYETIKTSNEPSEAISITESYLRGHSEIKGVLDSAEGVYYNAVALKEMGHAPGEIVNGGWNLNPEILGEVKSGYIFATIDQTPFYQGFFTVLELWANRNLGIIPFDIDTGSGWVDATNVDAVLKMSEAGWR